MRRRNSFRGMALIGLWAVRSFSQATLEDALLAPPALWTLSAEDVAKRLLPYGFAWESQTERSALRAAPRPGTPTPLAFLGYRPTEARVRFAQGAAAEVIVPLFTRGDSGDLAAEAFDQTVALLHEKISAWTRAPSLRQRAEKRTSAAEIGRTVWIQKPSRIDLEWGFTRTRDPAGRPFVRPEFITVRIAPYDPSLEAQLLGQAGRPQGPEATGLTLQNLRQRVQKDPNGDVWIASVPMVDQGQKGYCAAATLERLLRYYGRNFDQHDFAQIAGTTAREGTRNDEMIDSIERVSRQLKIRVVSLMDPARTSVVEMEPERRIELPKPFAQLLKDYNRLARRQKVPEIMFSDLMATPNLIGLYKTMKPELIREARLSKPRQIERDKFFEHIKRYTDSGAPLAWSLIVGLVPEPRAQIPGGLGGHLRTIIGYNERNKEIIFSDTWGPGYEKQRMKLDDAWIGTNGLYTILPEDLRL